MKIWITMVLKRMRMRRKMKTKMRKTMRMKMMTMMMMTTMMTMGRRKTTEVTISTTEVTSTHISICNRKVVPVDTTLR